MNTISDIFEDLINRAKPVNADDCDLSESQSSVIDQVRLFKLDYVYFNTDDNGNSFPAVFLKKVKLFDANVFREIAETHQKIWNYKKVLFLYVYSETEIRIYNCSETPLIKTQTEQDYAVDLKNIEIESYSISDKERLQELIKLFSRIAIDTGIIWTSDSKEAKAIRDKINLTKRVDKYLVKSLVNTADQLAAQGLDINFIHKLILRSLFLLYLEDRGATDKNFYSLIKTGAKTYFDILEDVEATTELFSRLEEHFNGNVFTVESDEKYTLEQLELIKKCFISGNDNTSQENLFPNWRLFDFKIIQIELLSEIYENFLSQTDPKFKEVSGTYYTPPSLVEFILNKKLPIGRDNKIYNVKILDPACGSGIFLVESFKRLVKRYENFHNKKLTDFNELVKLLKENIFGIELHPQAIKVAAFSLYLALVDKLDPKSLWQNKDCRLPNLINNPEDTTLKEQGNNLFCRDTISDLSTETTLQNFDLIVGNPPFGKLISKEKDIKGVQKEIRVYCDKYDFAKEMVLPFLHKATLFAPKGEIALIFNTKVLTNTGGTYQNFREWFFNKCYVEEVFNFSILRNARKNSGGQLFGDATGPISIVFYQKELPKDASDKIVYYAPKTYIKSNIIEGLCIDSSDIKYLPREECQKPDTKIWKIAMWGGMNDWELINKVLIKYKKTLGEFLKEHRSEYHFGSGLHAPSKEQIKENKTFCPNKVINLREVRRFYTLPSANKPSVKVFRTINMNIFTPPYLLIKEGQNEKEFCASYVDFISYHAGAYSISAIDESQGLNLKLWCCLINSSFAKYFLSLTSASWGIERERVQSNEIKMLPSLTEIGAKELETKFDQLIDIIKSDFNSLQAKDVELEIDRLMQNDILQLSEQENWIIEDFINYSIDLFENKENSIALYPALQDQVSDYAKTICAELNDFLEDEEIYANATMYDINRFTPLVMIKISHENVKKDINMSDAFVDAELKKIDRYLWEEKATNIYFRKKLNYKTGDDIYIIRPNQRRFWSNSQALEDASELILEQLTEN